MNSSRTGATCARRGRIFFGTLDILAVDISPCDDAYRLGKSVYSTHLNFSATSRKFDTPPVLRATP